jgi:hypothetical protein
MDIEAFISHSMQQIFAGINAAQSATKDKYGGAKINPRGVTAVERDASGNIGPHEMHTKLQIYRVEFDIAVSVSESSKTSGAVGIHVAVFAAGTKGETSTENSSISRIKFSIPVVWPDPTIA